MRFEAQQDEKAAFEQAMLMARMTEQGYAPASKWGRVRCADVADERVFYYQLEERRSQLQPPAEGVRPRMLQGGDADAAGSVPAGAEQVKSI